MANLLQQILAGESPEVASIGFNSDTIIRTALSLASVGMILILFGWLTRKQPLIAAGLAIITLVITLIYFNKKK